MNSITTEYVLEAAWMERLYCLPEELEHVEGNTIASIDCIGGKFRISINPAYCICPNNVKSFGIADVMKLELVRPQVIEFIEDYVHKNLEGEFLKEFME